MAHPSARLLSIKALARGLFSVFDIVTSGCLLKEKKKVLRDRREGETNGTEKQPGREERNKRKGRR